MYLPVLPYLPRVDRQVTQGEREHDHDEHPNDSTAGSKDVIRGLRNGHHLMLHEHVGVIWSTTSSSSSTHYSLLHITVIVVVVICVVQEIRSIPRQLNDLCVHILFLGGLHGCCSSSPSVAVPSARSIIITTAIIGIPIGDVSRCLLHYGRWYILHRNAIIQLAGALPQSYRNPTVEQLWGWMML